MHPLSGSKKIMIIGNCGTGKSTLSRKLGQILNMPVIHLDKLYFEPGWKEKDRHVFLNDMKSEMDKNVNWIVDGNYSRTIEKRAELADTIILLKVPLIISYFRIIKRRMIYRKNVRPDVPEGCHENLNWEMMKWMWDYKKRSVPKTENLMEEYKGVKTMIILESGKMVKEFLKIVSHELTLSSNLK